MNKNLLVCLTFNCLLSVHASEWQPSSVHLDAVKADGTLFDRIALGAVQIGSDEEEIDLEHRVQTDYFGHQRSVWVVPQLRTWLAPGAPGELVLVAPGGNVVFFDRASFHPGFFSGDRTNALAHIREIRTEAYEVEVPSGFTYFYERGCLRRFEDPMRRIYRVSTQGALVTRILGPDDFHTVAASYDSIGRISSLNVPDGSFRFSYTAGLGLLSSVTNGEGMILINFSYRGTLTCKVDDRLGASPERHFFSWKTNPAYHDDIRGYLQPGWLLASADENTYTVSSSNGLIKLHRLTNGHPDQILSFNTLTGSIVGP